MNREAGDPARRLTLRRPHVRALLLTRNPSLRIELTRFNSPRNKDMRERPAARTSSSPPRRRSTLGAQIDAATQPVLTIRAEVVLRRCKPVFTSAWAGCPVAGMRVVGERPAVGTPRLLPSSPRGTLGAQLGAPTVRARSRAAGRRRRIEHRATRRETASAGRLAPTRRVTPRRLLRRSMRGDGAVWPRRRSSLDSMSTTRTSRVRSR